MAKKKSQKDTFAEMMKEITGSSITQPKPVAVVEERKYFLIVCEGEKTEPAYFEYIQGMLPKNLLTTIEIHGQGDNTINIVKEAIKRRDARKKTTAPPYDEVWAVYDKDDFPADRYNQAVELAARKNIKSGHSNQSFELWYVLHFKNLQSALHRTDYIRILSTQIPNGKYEKNDRSVAAFMFEKGNVKRAIKWAKKLDEKCETAELTPADSCPHTRIYALVEELLKYCNPELMKS